jgi:hypothetical protein
VAAHDINDGKPQPEVGREHIHSTVPPHDTYEGRHRFDPSASWSPEEERKVVRKTDWRLLTWLCVMVRKFVPELMNEILTFPIVFRVAA